MRALIVTGEYSVDGRNPWLIDDLSRVLAEKGHSVEVVLHSAKGGQQRGSTKGKIPDLTVHSVGPATAMRGRLPRLIGHLLAGYGLHTRGAQITKSRQYDIIIYTSIALLSWGFPTRIRKLNPRAHLLFILWDFFPIHQVEIGRLREYPVLTRLLKRLEYNSARAADTIAVMSPANREYLKYYHPRLKNDVVILPPWSSSGEGDSSSTSPIAKRGVFTVLFGGQLALGRGISTLLDSAKLLMTESPGIQILIAGDGTERRSLEQQAIDLGLSNVTFMGHIARSKYRALLAECHIGVAITVPGVSAPSFPSKIVEYCGAGLPVVVCVEPSSDAGKIIEEGGAGVIASLGSPKSISDAITKLHDEHFRGEYLARSTRAKDLYLKRFSTTATVSKIEKIYERKDLRKP